MTIISHILSINSLSESLMKSRLKSENEWEVFDVRIEDRVTK